MTPMIENIHPDLLEQPSSGDSADREREKREGLERYGDFLAEKAPWLNYLAKKEFWDDLSETKEAESADEYISSISDDLEKKLDELYDKDDTTPEDWMELDYLVSDVHVVVNSREIFDKHICPELKGKYQSLHSKVLGHYSAELSSEEAEEKCDSYFYSVWKTDTRQRNYFHRAKDKESSKRYREFLLQKYDVDDNDNLIPLKFDESGDSVKAFRAGKPDSPLFEQTKEQFDKNTHDFVCLGGVVGLTTAFLLAKDGKDVAIIDEGKVGNVYKRWTMPWDEIYHLVELGIITEPELKSCVAEYRSFSNVLKDPDSERLDIMNKIGFRGAISTDSPKLLSLLREKLEQLNRDREKDGQKPNVTIMDNTSFDCLHDAGEGKGNIVKVIRDGKEEFLNAKTCVIDAMGLYSSAMVALNPDFAVDYVAPVVAVQARGYAIGEAPDEIKSTRNYELLATIANAEQLRTPYGELKETVQNLLVLNPDVDDSLVEYLWSTTSLKKDSPQNFFEMFTKLHEIIDNDSYKKRGKDFEILEHAIFGVIPSTTARNRIDNLRPRKGIVHIGDSIGGVSPFTLTGYARNIREMLARYAVLKHMSASGDNSPKTIEAVTKNSAVDPYTAPTELLLELIRKKEGDPKFLNQSLRNFVKAMDSGRGGADVSKWVYKQILRDRFTMADAVLGVYVALKAKNRLDLFKGLTKAFTKKLDVEGDRLASVKKVALTIKNFLVDQVSMSLAVRTDKAKGDLVDVLDKDPLASSDDQFQRINEAIEKVDVKSPQAIRNLFLAMGGRWAPGQERTIGAKRKDWSYAGVVINLLTRELGIKWHKKRS